MKGGIKLFFVGSTATISRDLIFGGIFALFRNELRLVYCNSSSNRKQKSSKKIHFCIDLISASFATILASPLNYVRNMHYATLIHEKPLTIKQHLVLLWKQTLQETELLNRLRFLQRRLYIGWGTARVGCGMAVGSYLYSLCSSNYDSITSCSWIKNKEESNTK